MTGTIYTFYENEEAISWKENTQENTQFFADFQREWVLSRYQKICGVPTPRTNQTYCNKGLRVLTLVE